MKYFILNITFICASLSLYPSEFVKKHAPSIITTSVAVGVGMLTTYYYCSFLSQSAAIIKRQDTYNKQLYLLVRSLSELQKSYHMIVANNTHRDLSEAVSVCENEIKTLSASVEALKQGRVSERRPLFTNTSLRTSKQ